jgi:hypothetical protein
MAVNVMEINSLSKVKKAAMSKSKIKSKLIVLFNVKGLSFCQNLEKYFEERDHSGEWLDSAA